MLALRDNARPHCLKKRALLRDFITKLDVANAATRERSGMLTSGISLDLLRIAEDRITIARSECTVARTVYSNHICGRDC